MSLQHSGAVRLFSPQELLHLFGFPDSYSFPSNMTTRHKYRAIGQSINKIVVQMLMHSELCRHASVTEDGRKEACSDAGNLKKRVHCNEDEDGDDVVVPSKKVREQEE